VKAKKKKASGVNIPNTQRHTVQILLRVPPEVKEKLDDLAERWGVTRSGAVAQVLEMYEAAWGDKDE
jgi:predicted DNA-binding protein